ncbi:hypothetical protein [Candidatus Regiella insecticola]|uniref:hypothetical protein n=1 Tax=Candidatus Regiella insecticola TaxID=138073 RepID=UPI000586F4C7|nr:hypothetical protein [Candidatus Regiella insecticola]
MLQNFPNSTLLSSASGTIFPDATLYRIPPEIAVAGVAVTLGVTLLCVRNVARNLTPQNVVPLANTFANSLVITGFSLMGLQVYLASDDYDWRNLPYHFLTGVAVSVLMVFFGLDIREKHNPAPFRPPF